MRYRLQSPLGEVSWRDAPEVTLQHSGADEDVAEVTAAAAPTDPPTGQHLTDVFAAMHRAGWKPAQERPHE